ncbi:MAG: M23 family metallopeptidase [Bacillota bacterium]
MIGFLKNIWIFLMEKVNIHISPKSPGKKVKNFKIRRIYPIISAVLIVFVIFSLGFLYKSYENKYQIVSDKLDELNGVYQENEELEKELLTLSRETEELKQGLNDLKEYNNKIASMISDTDKNNKLEEEKIENIELRTAVSYNNQILEQGIPRGGGDFRLLYQDTNELIKSMQKNINAVKKEIPEEEKELENLEENIKKYNKKLAATPSIWPVKDNGDGYVSSNFGWRNDPNTSEREFHEGLDIAVWYNTPVLATAYGTVSYTGWENGFGWVVKIEHGFGYKTIYGHLNHIEVKEGEDVKRGQTIALTGNSGRSTGPHLHYEVRVNDSPKNPREFIGR